MDATTNIPSRLPADAASEEGRSTYIEALHLVSCNERQVIPDGLIFIKD